MRAVANTIVIIICLFLSPTAITAQNRYNIETDIERAVKDFFLKMSEMNSPVEPISPESFASAYQKGINIFLINGKSIKMVDFLNWYKRVVLANYSISHRIQIKSITKLQENNRYLVKCVLHREIENDSQVRHISDENVEIKAVWRGQEVNNVSIQSISSNFNLNFIKPNVIDKYEFQVWPIVTHLSAFSTKWEFEVISNKKSMEGFDGEERKCIKTEPINITYESPDKIIYWRREKKEGTYFSNRVESFSGYVGQNKSKKARCFLIIIRQKESGNYLRHYIYQEGRKKR